MGDDGSPRAVTNAAQIGRTRERQRILWLRAAHPKAPRASPANLGKDRRRRPTQGLGEGAPRGRASAFPRIIFNTQRFDAFVSP